MMNRQWKKKVELGDVWNNEELEFTERRDVIVRRLKILAPWAARQDAQYSPDLTFAELVEDLADCEDYDEFNLAWDELYDWADQGKRLWIDLWKESSNA